jgi:hypothetical protein
MPAPYGRDQRLRGHGSAPGGSDWDAGPVPPHERADIRREAEEVAGADWLGQPNARLGGRTPEEVIRAGHEEVVRDLLRSIRYVGVS